MSNKYYISHKEKWRGYYNTRRQKAPLYAAWRSMMTRCGFIKGAKAHDRRRYITRGITICEYWRTYANFEKWALAHGWRRGLQIDRIDNGGNYEPSNCRFVTAKENAGNRDNCIWVVYHGQRMRLVDAYKKSGCTLNYKLVNGRVRIGWTPELAFGEKEAR